MSPITHEDLRRFAPRAAPHYVTALIDGWAQIQAAGINTPMRWCHFVAQCAHETGYFTIVREHTTWTAKQMCALWPHRFKTSDPLFSAKYQMACRGDEKSERLAEMAYGCKVRPDLGNTEEGDGYAYRGGGFLQGTGRNWYREVGEAIGVDLEGSPDLIEVPEHSLAASLWYWQRYKINTFADANNLRAVGNAINRGNAHSKHEPIGAAERKRCFERAWAIWGAGSQPSTTDLDVGSSGPDAMAVQLRLRELRYPVGSPDGVFGPETGRAIAAFKADWAREHGTPIEAGTIVGPLTKAALAEAEPISRPEREEATEGELLAAGSSEMKAGHDIQQLGKVTALVGSVGVANQAGALDAVQSSLGWVPTMQTTLAPVVESLRWAGAHLPFVALVVVGLLAVYRGHVIKQARLLAHQLGFNLGR